MRKTLRWRWHGMGMRRPRPHRVESAAPASTRRSSRAAHSRVRLAWRAGRSSDHDALIGRTLAHVMAGGSLPHPTAVSDAYLRDLEREAFLKLCGELKTRQRMEHTLKTGKPLRN